jgi:hypothetical protein
MSVARSRVHCSSVIGLSLITYLPISSAVSFRNESAPASAGSGGFEALRNFRAFAPGRGIFGDRLMIVPKDARALLHCRRCARPRHLRVLRRERAGGVSGHRPRCLFRSDERRTMFRPSLGPRLPSCFGLHGMARSDRIQRRAAAPTPRRREEFRPYQVGQSHTQRRSCSWGIFVLKLPSARRLRLLLSPFSLIRMVLRHPLIQIVSLFGLRLAELQRHAAVRRHGCTPHFRARLAGLLERSGERRLALAALARGFLRGRALGRLVGHVPQGHWKTITFVAALRRRGMRAAQTIDGAMTGKKFLA